MNIVISLFKLRNSIYTSIIRKVLTISCRVTLKSVVWKQKVFFDIEVELVSQDLDPWIQKSNEKINYYQWLTYCRTASEEYVVES